jgi:hypothetical protein
MDHWNSLTLYFKHRILEDNSPTVQSLLNAFRNPVFKLYLCFLSYVLQLVTHMNMNLQSEKPKLPELLGNMTTLNKTILKCYIKPEHLVGDLNIGSVMINNPHIYRPLSELYLGANFDIIEKNCNVSQSDLHNVKLRCLDFLIELSRQIKCRFDFDDKYLKFAVQFNPSVATSGTIMSIADWSNLFPYLKLDLESVNIEWQMLSELNLPLNKTDINTFWKQVNKTTNALGKPMFLNSMILTKVILCLPHSSAAAERVFSQLSLMKSPIRNRLAITTGSNILHPDGMTLVPWIKGQPLVWDVTVVDTLADSYVLKTFEVSGFAAEMACKRKHSKCSSIISSNYIFKGLALGVKNQ